ncbi:MAG: Mrp/NBP35 family ATP-binding protein [Desulfobacterales bacterium]|nr:Mrp/NBP35 family ATP-binding protein [Desulfobacterales bacterium]
MAECSGGSCGQNQDQQKSREIQEQAVKDTLGKIKHKFLVMSGKGGVGKTSVSVNLAIALANKGYKVGIMDVDLHGPDVPRMLGLEGMIGASENQKLAPMQYSENLTAISIESLMPNKDDAVIWRGPLKHSAISQFISDVDWGELDFLIVDSPPGTGDEPLSVAQTIEDCRPIIVTTPQEVALWDIRKSINFCKKIQRELFGLVENMSGYVCPHCGKTADLFGTGGGEKTAKEFGINFLGRIPFDPNLVKAGDSGSSFQDAYKDSEAAQAFAGIAGHLIKLMGE